MITDEAFKTDEWEERMPMFYPICEEPSFPFAEVPTETIFCWCEGMTPKDQVCFLSSMNAVAQRPGIKVRLFQLKRAHRMLFNLWGEWAYYIRWIQPRQLAHNIPKQEDRIGCAYRH